MERVWPTVVGQVITTIWYPSLPAEPRSAYLNLYPANAASEATPLTGQFPLVILVCGTGGTRYSHSYLAESLAAQGFWVIAPETSKIPQQGRVPLACG